MKVYIYNQNCVMAGQSVPERELERYEKPEDGGDWTAYEGTRDELVELARSLIRNARSAGAGDDRYYRRVARTILEALLWDSDRIDNEIFD